MATYLGEGMQRMYR